jgi:hypothetical protein
MLKNESSNVSDIAAMTLGGADAPPWDPDLPLLTAKILRLTSAHSRVSGRGGLCSFNV